jgi:hypothetical protein
MRTLTRRAALRPLLFLASLAALACGGPKTQSISGVIRDASGPVQGAVVRLQHFPTTECRDLGASTRELTAVERAEFALCAIDLFPVSTDASGAFGFPDLAAGWYSMSVRWTIDQRPAVAAPNTVIDGFAIIYLETRSMPPRYILSALGTAPFELKPGQQLTRDFTHRP